jgi:hypothetical protein
MAGFFKVQEELAIANEIGLISHSAYIVGITIASFMRRKNSCWPSVATIAMRARFSLRSTHECLSELKQSGVLVSKRRRRGSSIYSFDFSEILNCNVPHDKTTFKNCGTPHDKDTMHDKNVIDAPVHSQESHTTSPSKNCTTVHDKNANQELRSAAPRTAVHRAKNCGTPHIGSREGSRENEVEETPSFSSALETLDPSIARAMSNARSSQKQIAASRKKKNPPKKIPGDSV